MSETTTPNTRACAITGQETAGKLYVLQTTDGPAELVSGEALFHQEADLGLGDLILELEERVKRLEEQLAERDQDHGQDVKHPSKGRTESAGQEGSKPVKAVKKAPQQRKASD